MSRGPLCEMVPIENAAMEDRTVIEWDKDDIEELGILKVDVLALGMLTCISKAFELLTPSHVLRESARDQESTASEASRSTSQYARLVTHPSPDPQITNSTRFLRTIPLFTT